MKILILTVLLILITASIIGCGEEKKTSDNGYSTITAKEAKEIIDSEDTITILDVRTPEEYSTGHIEGAILIPDSEISEKAEEVLVDKTATILVYCRSGRRSALAAAKLAELGYSNVYDFGGILDWEYDIVTE